jgi:hypothetical protein
MVSFFVSLPILLATVSGWVTTRSRQNAVPARETRFLALEAFISVLVSVEGLYQRTKNSAPEASSLVVKRLMEIRKKSDTAQIVAANDRLLHDNPSQQCTARPFLYPAVSERPWVGVIVSDGDCRYEWYAYEGYNVSRTQSRVVPAPVLRGLAVVPVDLVQLVGEGEP